jgi:hypothetical protein
MLKHSHSNHRFIFYLYLRHTKKNVYSSHKQNAIPSQFFHGMFRGKRALKYATLQGSENNFVCQHIYYYSLLYNLITFKIVKRCCTFADNLIVT